MCRGLPLQASLTSSFTHESDLLDAERILKHQSLLGTLEITVIDADLQHSLFKKVKLPVLRTLKLEYLRLHMGIPASHFYETWEMPELRYLETNFVPLRALGKAIVSFKLDISDLSCDLFFGLDRTLEFLASCPLLENLDVRFDDISEYITPETGVAVIMRNLRTLTLQAASPDYFSWLARFLERLVIDNVTDLSLGLNKLRRSWNDVEVMAKRMTMYQETEMWGPVIVSRIAKIPRLREMKLYIEEGRAGKEGTKEPSKDEYIWAFISVIRELPPTLERFVSISPLHHIHMCRKHVHIDGGRTHLDIVHGKTLTLEQLLFFMDWAKAKSGTIILRDSPLIPEDLLR
ncbi:hypothetical protein A7U60_g5701 [Sanghuangporus baumii]|uniref:Uncharacterized protein n=1 Tax=Sanghuangporus baumii TaxID=108892 RepID=A0A9Q5HWK4_SANBA|nr:hypothetical protein A7U60_g5701 [Sanghuangporus baumii]